MQVDKETLGLIVEQRTLLRVLEIIDRHDGISTRKLLKQLGANGLHKLVLEAESRGFIQRESEPPEGKGHWLVRNHLTPKGRKLLTAANRLVP